MWSAVAVAAIAAVVVIPLLTRGKDHDSLMLGVQVEGGGFTAHGGEGIASVQKDAPGIIARNIALVVGPYHQRGFPRRSEENDVTVATVWLRLYLATWHTSNWRKASNKIRQTFGRPLVSEGTVVGSRTLGESEKLYLRITAQGQFYVSTAEDREHALHAPPFDDDSSLPTRVTSVCQDHWSDWISKIDSLSVHSTSPR